MDAANRERILYKNDELIRMVIQRAKRDFPEDIAIIGLTGSFNTGDYYEKSDLDLIIINNTPQGWGISSCFILEDVGYDIYCTPWETRIEEQANLESSMIACLIDLQVLYCAKQEYLEKLNGYKQRALDELAKPIGKDCIRRAKKYIDQAKQEYANTLLSEDIGVVRFASSELLYHLLNALTNLNNTYLKLGFKRYLKEIASYRYVPEHYEKNHMAVIHAKTIHEIRSASYIILSCVIDLYQRMDKELVIRPVPTYDNLNGTYEELWCNYRNKMLHSIEIQDKFYAYHVANGIQGYLDEMTEMIGTPKFDLMQYFDSDDLQLFKEKTLQVMDEYLEEYNRVGRKAKHYDTFEALYKEYMKV